MLIYNQSICTRSFICMPFYLFLFLIFAKQLHMEMIFFRILYLYWTFLKYFDKKKVGGGRKAEEKKSQYIRKLNIFVEIVSTEVWSIWEANYFSCICKSQVLGFSVALGSTAHIASHFLGYFEGAIADGPQSLKLSCFSLPSILKHQVTAGAPQTPKYRANTLV